MVIKHACMYLDLFPCCKTNPTGKESRVFSLFGESCRQMNSVRGAQLLGVGIRMHGTFNCKG